MKKLQLKSNELIHVLEPLQAVINPGHIVPILQCVKIITNGTELSVIGDNHEVRCQNSMPCKGDEIEICVDFSMLLTALKGLKDQDVNIKVDSKIMKIIHDKGDFKIPLEETSSFPDPKTDDLDKSATIGIKNLKKALKIANKFLLNDSLEPMSNLSIQVQEKKIIVRSSNNTTLFQEKIKGGGDEASILVSGKTSSAIFLLMEEEVDEVELRYSESRIFFKFGNKEVTAIQQQGKFPLVQFEKIISTIDDSEVLKIDKISLITSLRRVSSLSMKEKLSMVKMILDRQNLNLSCNNENSSSQVKEDLPVKFKGKEKILAYNAKMLIEILSVFDDECEFSINKGNCFCMKTKRMSGLIAPMLLS